MTRRVLLHLHVTIDGVAEYPEYPESLEAEVSREDDPPWLPDLDAIDTLLLGRKTYLVWAGFWPQQKEDPSADEFLRKFSRFADRAEKVVFSKTLERADWPNSRIVRGDLSTEIARLRSTPGGDIALGGGPRLGQSLLAHDLVDELFLTVFPSIAARGKPAFHIEGDPDHAEDRIPIGAPGRMDFALQSARPRSDGVLRLHYRRDAGKRS